MKSSSNHYVEQQQSSYLPPPPEYSPPGQQPPQQHVPIIQMQPKDYTTATAPPPPGLHAPNSTNVQTQQPMIIYSNTITPVSFGPYPMRFTCPNCNAHVMTETHSNPGLLTYILSCALCVIVPYIPCCCFIPCCVRECKDIEHRCPSCQHKLGLFKRI